MRHDKKYNELQDIREAMDRIWRRVMRNINAYDKLCDRERRLLKRNADAKIKKDIKVTGEEWHKIRHQVGELNDAIDF